MLSSVEDKIFIWAVFMWMVHIQHSDYITHVEQGGEISNNTVLIFM